MEKENISKISVDQPQTSTEPGDPSASGFESITETESENQLCLFVSCWHWVLTKCHALQNCSQEEWFTHTKRLVNQTIKGLNVIEGFCPDVKSTNKVCKAVLKQ